MATTATPRGLVPVKLLGDRPYNHGYSRYQIASTYNTDIYKGDIVQLVTAGTIEKDTGTATATPIGVFMGVQYTDPNLGYLVHSQRWPANTVATDALAYVAADPDLIFEIQADGIVAQTALNANFGVTQGAGDNTTQLSGVDLDIATINSTSTLPLRLVGFVDRPGSAVGDAFTDVYVMWNEGTHQLRNATGLA